MHVGGAVKGQTPWTLASAREAVVRAVPEVGPPKALGILEPRGGDLLALCGPGLAKAAPYLARFDVVVGLNVRAALEGLELDPSRWKLIDVRPPVRELAFSPGAKPVPITTEMLVRDTLAVRHRFLTESDVRHRVKRGMTDAVGHRLEEDATALHLLRRYGSAHRRVRVEYLGCEQFLPVDWALPGELRVDEVLRRACALGSGIVLLLRPPRQLLDWPCVPVQCRILDVGERVAGVEPTLGEFTVPLWRIEQAWLVEGRTDQ